MQYKKWETFRKLVKDTYYDYYIATWEEFEPTNWQTFIDVAWNTILISWDELKNLHKVKNVPQWFTDDLWDNLKNEQCYLDEKWKLYFSLPNEKKYVNTTYNLTKPKWKNEPS